MMHIAKEESKCWCLSEEDDCSFDQEAAWAFLHEQPTEAGRCAGACRTRSTQHKVLVFKKSEVSNCSFEPRSSSTSTPTETGRCAGDNQHSRR
jgi:hypothetical protein